MAEKAITANGAIDDVSVPAGQDALYGRDAINNISKFGQGHAGFDYTKLDSNGDALADQEQAWSETGSEVLGTKWSCVKDNVTGLIWEVKTTSGLHNAADTFTWFISEPTKNGGTAGTADDGTGTTCSTQGRCDTEKFIADVNSSAEPFCGQRNWRLPTDDELNSLVNYGVAYPAVDQQHFPNTEEADYWTSSTRVTGEEAWLVNFDIGYRVRVGENKSQANAVRLVVSP